jgi:hypothetical protein
MRNEIAFSPHSSHFYLFESSLLEDDLNQELTECLVVTVSRSCWNFWRLWCVLFCEDSKKIKRGSQSQFILFTSESLIQLLGDSLSARFSLLRGVLSVDVGDEITLLFFGSLEKDLLRLDFFSFTLC